MTQLANTATDNYPLCDGCAAAIVNADMGGFAFDPQISRLVETFVDAAGMLVHTGTNPVPDTVEWDCAACREPQIGDADWVTTL
ncbi:hypothetical protein [Gordonia humi]|uniref:Uncharacterized protein n=1 Tax=Gordonia humi TaxID=686429 RepID=A0A840F6B1_9ACTN|nr:hypothetical protein [Gordonia humi]MBB4138093.1 hypothetical protein [Gordonia humi]